MRIQKSYQVLNKSDIGILVIDGTFGQTDEDKALINKFKEKNKNAKLYLFLFIIYQTIICIVTIYISMFTEVTENILYLILSLTNMGKFNYKRKYI